MRSSYDTIGVNYADLRKPDSRIERLIGRALGSAKTVLNVGAGTGSYEPAERQVTAIEPSAEMIRQRAVSAAPAVQGYAEDLPFEDSSFDASMAILTVHHWANKEKGLKEMRRVTRGPVVVLTYDPAHRGFWLADYIPELVALDEARMPRITDYQKWLGPLEISTVPIPRDCTDGFLCAYWRRPAAYLDPGVRAAMSSFWALGNISEKLQKLASDLDSGAWAQRYSELLNLDACDLGYRLVTTE
ncbi:class I SAM-dependent methyltransferase [Algihabitans albus]|uniref:class I SAM-dependent methyltransferase n=1 Tax=Algihabitans albus TaxID=2164067 RepID=UPI000E5C6A37|nr:class I SAM-dependent methyltransferase [Algihabitans albus]